MGVPLPSPTSVTRKPLSQVQRSDPSRGVLHSRRTSKRRVIVYEVVWSARRDLARHAVLEHYYENFRAPFAWTPPQESTPIEVMYLDRPSSSHSRGRWTTTARFETSL